MARKLDIPYIGVVENMAGFVSPIAAKLSLNASVPEVDMKN